MGKLSVALSLKIITSNGNSSLIELLKKLPLSVVLLWLSVHAFYERGNNLSDMPRLNQEVRGYFTAPYGP